MEETIRAIVREEIRAALGEEPRFFGGGVATSPPPDLVALGDVKRWVQVSKSTLKKWIGDGRLKKYGEGRLVRVKLSEVRAVFERRNLSAAPKSQASGVSPEVQRILSSIPGGRG